ncbi:Spherulation-specific family 4 [Clohesyomyces aquaticus]|uniref:Spherulation-specific family 4 n=1 Tax=Clohesyomyces aquaticus TaxID=1231657 RepID=A0A1Y2A3Q4_9PLEO|nr:Spherulation-specific family 4 [Clohesyomyces aquaticus]
MRHHQKPTAFWKKNKRFRPLLVVSICAILAVTTVTTAWLIRGHIRQLPITILVPLYMSPEADAWDPLYEAALAHGQVQFTAIVNPHVGPEPPPLPTKDYIEAIQKLNVLPNIQTVGYVDTVFGRKSHLPILREMEMYAGWGNETGLGVHGIFFDHTPSNGSMDTRKYLETIDASVKNATGIMEPRIVFHNPGTVPDVNITSQSTDVTIVFEGTFQDRTSLSVMRTRMSSLPSTRSKYGYLIHSVPEDTKRVDLRFLVNDVKKVAQYIFVTDLTRPDLEFVVIVNPNSGPGSHPWWPNADYVREIPRLNAYANVRTIGYVRTGYCKRPIEDVYQDIATYAGWSKNEASPGLWVDGIFFDETTNVYSAKAKAYLDGITEYVKQSEGIRGDKTVIHNPGTAVDARLAAPGPDITTVAEVAHSVFRTPEYQEWLSTSCYERSRTSYIVHGVPAVDMSDFTHELRQRAAYLFVTSLGENYYSSFGSCWPGFVESLGR